MMIAKDDPNLVLRKNRRAPGGRETTVLRSCSRRRSQSNRFSNKFVCLSVCLSKGAHKSRTKRKLRCFCVSCRLRLCLLPFCGWYTYYPLRTKYYLHNHIQRSNTKMTLLTDACTAYLAPLLKKHAADEPLVLEDLEASRVAAGAVLQTGGGNTFVSVRRGWM